VITGGEPTLQKGLREAIRFFKEQGLKVKLDTNGSHPEVVKSLIADRMIDYIAMDIKGPIEGYDRWCGTKVDKAAVRESLELIMMGHVEYEFRMTLVPFLHREHDAYQAAEQIKGARRFFIQDFVPRDTINPKYSSIRPFSPEKMKSVRDAVRLLVEDASIRHHLH
jgi:pyruvate formate lyase activating enzyme